MTGETDRLVDDLVAARAGFMSALDAADAAGVTAPGHTGEWSARELVAHLGYWAGHAVEVIHAVETGRADEVGADEPPTEEVNATVARVAGATSLGTVVKREAASVQALLERLAALDPSLLRERVGTAGTLEDAIREDGPAHYHEHTEALWAAMKDR